MTDCTAQPLDAYFDNELSPDARREVDEHLAACARCRIELAAIGRVSASLRAHTFPPLLPIERARLHRAVDRAGESTVFRLFGAISGVAAALLVANSLWLITTPETAGAETVSTGAEPWERFASTLQVDEASGSQSAVVNATDWMLNGVAGESR